MNILIAGGTGFIGQALIKHWLAQKVHTITVLGRDAKKIHTCFLDEVKIQTWDNLNVEDIENHNIIINLCGKGLADRHWSDSFKQELLDSRLEPTEKLAKLISTSINKPSLFNASGISSYGPQPPMDKGLPEPYDETTPIDFDATPDFLSTIARRWEKATKAASSSGARVVIMRTAVVLGQGGGALKKMKLPFQLGLGGPIGAGTQPFAWIALPDLINAIEFLIQHDNISGPVNLVSPNTVTQREFAQTLGSALNRPAILPMPTFMIKLIFGQMGEETLLKGNHCRPKTLLDNGFRFDFANLKEALKVTL